MTHSTSTYLRTLDRIDDIRTDFRLLGPVMLENMQRSRGGRDDFLSEFNFQSSLQFNFCGQDPLARQTSSSWTDNPWLGQMGWSNKAAEHTLDNSGYRAKINTHEICYPNWDYSASNLLIRTNEKIYANSHTGVYHSSSLRPRTRVSPCWIQDPNWMATSVNILHIDTTQKFLGIGICDHKYQC